MYLWRPSALAITDPEQMLYSGGFFSDADRATMTQVRKASGKQLAAQTFVFEDKRLPEMLFRYRARNFPQTLNGDEREQWKEFCSQRLTDQAAGASVVVDDFRQRLRHLRRAARYRRRTHGHFAHLAAYADALLQICALVNAITPQTEFDFVASRAAPTPDKFWRSG